MTIRVYHGYYGCETGCCGHWLEINGEDVKFDFCGSPDDTYESKKQYAIAFAKDYIKRAHPNCYDTIDWEDVDFNDAGHPGC